MSITNLTNDENAKFLKSESVESGISLNNPGSMGQYNKSLHYNLEDGETERPSVGEINTHGFEPFLNNVSALRKISSEIVSEVLEKAENQLNDMSHKPSELNANALLPNINGSGNGDSNLYVNYKPPLENNDKEIHLNDVLDKMYSSEDFAKKIEFEMNKFDPTYDVDPDTVCGIGCFKPQWLQPWATARVYLVLYCMIGILSGSYYSYLIGTMSTLEKRFSFKSKISGIIMTVDEITPLFLGVLVGYFGGRAHRPRVVAFGMLMSSICCFVSALPYFIYGAAKHLNVKSFRNDTGLEMCDSDVGEENCDSDDKPPTMAPILILMFGSFLKGFGNLAYYAVGLAYMDDNSKQKNTPMYLGECVFYVIDIISTIISTFY